VLRTLQQLVVAISDRAGRAHRSRSLGLPLVYIAYYEEINKTSIDTYDLNILTYARKLYQSTSPIMIPMLPTQVESANCDVREL
jgi:hypothetical protein